MGLLYRKVGRLYPGEDDRIHVIRDGFEEIGVITREGLREIAVPDAWESRVSGILLLFL
jgi:hypothetical protein